MDFTKCRKWTGFVHVSFIVDVFVQKIVAWHAATSKGVELAMTPLRMAIWQSQGEGHSLRRREFIGYAGAGSQHTSINFTENLNLEGVRPSSSTDGDEFDNALMVTVIGLFKIECIRTAVAARVLPQHRLRQAG